MEVDQRTGQKEIQPTDDANPKRRSQGRWRPGVAGLANQREGKEIAKDDIVVGRIEEDGPRVAEGTVEEVCRGNHCFLVHWEKIYGQQRLSRTKHMSVTWESQQQAEAHGVKFAIEVTTCQAQGLPEEVGG